MPSDYQDETHCKVVYYGPVSSGKSTNLQFICANVPELARGDLSSLNVGEGNARVEFLPLDMGSLFGRRVRFHVYGVPSGLGNEADRVSILSGADGIVFVVDSRRERFRDDLLSFREMEMAVEGLGMDLGQIPLVFQYNKRDLPDAVPVLVLNTRLNSASRPYVEAVAPTGAGVLSTLRAVSKLVVEKLQRGKQ